VNAAPAHILFVDDEMPVLRSLQRLLRPTGHAVHLANSGPEGLRLLDEHPIEIVISDMRMPEMDGAQFLTSVAAKWPETTRMLLTGYADLTSAIDAINNGYISRYLTKPWQDGDLLMSIEQAIENQRLVKEKKRLEKLTSEQNAALRALNESLEEKVEQRTRAIEAARRRLIAAHDELQASYRTTIEVFARMVQSRSGLEMRTSVAHDARAVGELMGLDEDQCNALYDAALLCDVGKLGLPDAAVARPYTLLDVNAQREYHRHPLIAETTLVSLEPLASAASIIRNHCERIDGLGFPDKLKGTEIPLPARILAVCKAYADLQDGKIFDERMTSSEARAFLVEQKDARYESNIVDHFLTWLENPRRSPDGHPERKLTLGRVRVGMKTSRDLVDAHGVLILARGQRISRALRDRLVKIQDAMESPLTIHIQGT
jgi:response regulator RpfG family c-di-GMP phosphodiesterase